MFSHFIPKFIISSGLWLLLVWCGTPGLLFAQDSYVWNPEMIRKWSNIREFGEGEVTNMGWLEEQSLAVQWLFLPEERLGVKPLYGYRLQGLIERCNNMSGFSLCNMEIHNPALVYHGSASGDDFQPGIFKLEWDWYDDTKENTLNLDSVVSRWNEPNPRAGDPNTTVEYPEVYDYWYLATDTFIPDISSDNLYIISKEPSTAFTPFDPIPGTDPPNQ